MKFNLRVLSILAAPAMWFCSCLALQASEPVVLADVGGFTDDEIYPAGNLQSVTDGGATWTVTENPDKKQLSAVAFGNNTWVALNGFMNVFAAKNPSQGFVAAPDLTMALRGVVFNSIKFTDGKFYAFGNDHRVMTSVDGSTWAVNPARDAAVDAFGALFVE